MARKSCRVFFAMAIGLALFMASQSVSAQEPFYKGKTVRLLVNYPAGGATDVVARLVSRYLGKHLAGNPTIAVQNMPGGGGNVGANYVFEVASPDGLTVGVFSGGYLPQILGGAGVRFDLNKMPMIAGVGETSVVYIRADTGVKGPGEILKPAKPIVIGGFTRESNKDLALRMALDLLGVPYRYVTGYAGSGDFPTTPGSYDPTGGGDAFAVKLNATGTALVYSTYLGGGGDQWASALAVDNAGNAYVGGATTSFNFPTTVGAFQRSPGDACCQDLFLAKLNSTGAGLLY